MTEPPRSSPRDPRDLWHRLAEAQDAALAGTGASTRATQETDLVAPPVAARVLRRRVLRRTPAIALSLLGAAAAAVVLVSIRHRAQPLVQTERTDSSGAASRVVLTDAHSDLPLQFSDGSSLTFRAGSAGGMQRLGDSGADIVLDRGRVDAHVVHAQATLWLIHAGPFKVRVTGTRFSVAWSAHSARLEVAVYEGSVVIDGGALGAGVPLRAGHQLTVENSVVRTDLVAAADPLSGRAGVALQTAEADEPRPASPEVPGTTAIAGRVTGPASPGVAGNVDASRAPQGGPMVPALAPLSASGSGSASQVSHELEWLPLAQRGAYREALSTAKRLGWGNLCGRLDARRLLMLGDVARYADAPLDAERAFGSLVARYPTHLLAGDAVFSLGRLAFEAGRPEKAARWFRRYVDDWPKGPLVDQALGRLMESAARAGDGASARSAAEAYLSRAPHGPHAPLAREIVEGAGPSDPPQ